MIISVIASIVVATVAYRGSLRGIRTQIDAAAHATQRDERAEHARWLRDRAADAFLVALDLTETWYDYRRQLYGCQIERENGGTPTPVTEEDAELPYRQVAARLELFGDARLRNLLDQAKEAHDKAVYDLQLVIRGETPPSEGPPVPDISDVHDHLDDAIRADEGLRAALVEAIKERPSLRLDLAQHDTARRGASDCPACGHDWREHEPEQACSECRYEIEHDEPGAPRTACTLRPPGKGGQLRD